MPSRTSSQWQSRRKPSLGKLRRAHPASGATWNVQVVRGKMTSKCLWHACRALALGMVLMLLGAGMATIGYYADHLSIGQEIRGNATVRVKNESRGFHLNNLSYVGPIVMGFGGFIVVAACVMTFEARDSAAKVVPARFKMTSSSRSNIRSNNSSAASQRRANGMMHQSNRWDHHLGVFRTSPAEPQPPLDRQALTAALIHFSKAMGQVDGSIHNSPRQSPHSQSRRFSRSGSVPDLASSHRSSVHSNHLSPSRKHLLGGGGQHSPHQHHGHHGRHMSHSRGSRASSSLVQRVTRESASSLLHPGMLQFHRHALSVDETGPYYRDSPHGSHSSVTLMDSHEARRDRTKRSDTAKRHVLARQKPIEKEEPHSPRLPYSEGRRRSSTTSDASYASRRIYRRTSSASRTPSIDSRSVQVELHSPDTSRASPRTPRRFNSVQSSTPSVERELRSQLSVCSEPTTVRQLSGQSSLEPCVLEESPELEEREPLADDSPHNISNKSESYHSHSLGKQNQSLISNHRAITPKKKPRPGSLTLDGTYENSKSARAMEVKKSLYRSNSTRTFNRPKPKLINEYDQIYFISTNGSVGVKANGGTQDDLYDSLQVINERRKKILDSARTQSSNDEHKQQQQQQQQDEPTSNGTNISENDVDESRIPRTQTNQDSTIPKNLNDDNDSDKTKMLNNSVTNTISASVITTNGEDLRKEGQNSSKKSNSPSARNDADDETIRDLVRAKDIIEVDSNGTDPELGLGEFARSILSEKPQSLLNDDGKERHFTGSPSPPKVATTTAEKTQQSVEITIDVDSIRTSDIHLT